jgi:hypothetical protein
MRVLGRWQHIRLHDFRTFSTYILRRRPIGSSTACADASHLSSNRCAAPCSADATTCALSEASAAHLLFAAS